ncbi:MAG TPA: ribonuclease Y [Thermoanaerobaculia bacterium]|nr:ribonuclease Y [Thermoanaerobaculia bacterium]HUM29413.1 ribonuclease Y [Thermoanaerobaculia bacterium]HXK67659.1 ribonuclease Y [Thermoanaerobaculia bacterium]
MTNIILAAIAGFACAAICFILYLNVKKNNTLTAAREDARRIIDEATKDSQRKVKEAELEAKDKVYQARQEFERQSRDQRKELQQVERRLNQREEKMDRRTQQLEQAENRLKNQEQSLTQKEKKIEEKNQAAEALVQEQQRKLEEVAGLTADQAKKDLIKSMEQDARMDAAQIVKRIEEEAREQANNQAKYVLASTMQRIASDVVMEQTVSVVDLPSDEMKGRIIGREGRNIRALEMAAGVDLIIDDTPEAVTISCFDPLRRELARMALERLITDGRIHPARIEEIVQKVRAELDSRILEEGEAAAFELGIPDLHIEIIKHLGRLRYRTSYGQSVLQHSKEVAQLSARLALEIKADVNVARRAGLLHDIGKAIDREMEGSHLELGVQMLRKYGESESVIHAMECHHGDVEPRTVEAVLVTIADALSAARPGARREALESYVRRLEKLEGIANDFKGVSKAYAIQAGRELRIIVESTKINDAEAMWLSKDVARRIEQEVQYPGQIKVMVIRETRAVDYAK